jgi:probable HAF family extracellular repeat protein
LGGSFSEGFSINDLGQVTGESTTGTAGRAFLYSNGQMRDLGTLGGSTGEGLSINDLGQITGDSDITTGGSHAFLYSDGQMRDLGTLGGSFSEGDGINDLGQVTGQSFPTASGHAHAFLYSNGQMRDLGTLGGLYSVGSSINDLGQVTGYFGTGFADHAFLYSDGQMRDLNNLIDPALGVTLGYATGINDKGQIVANDILSGHAYLLTPVPVAVPEPGTLTLFGGSLLAVGYRARKRLRSRRQRLATPPFVRPVRIGD